MSSATVWRQEGAFHYESLAQDLTQDDSIAIVAVGNACGVLNAMLSAFSMLDLHKVLMIGFLIGFDRFIGLLFCYFDRCAIGFDIV